MQSMWREHARKVLVGVLTQAQAEEWDRAQLEQAIFDAYPFGMREYYPYSIWLSEKKLCLEAYDHKTTMAHMAHVRLVRQNRRPKAEPVSEAQEALPL